MWWTSVTQLALGAAVFLIGWWGRRNAGELGARSSTGRTSTEPTAESRQWRVIRRGGLTCQVVGCFFAVLSALPLL